MTNQQKKKPENIFEAASELEKARHENEKEAISDFEKQNEEIRALFKRCQDMHEELSSRLDRAFEQSGITERQYREYFNRPQNFSEKEWARVVEQRKINEEKLKKLSPRGILAKKNKEEKVLAVPPKKVPPEGKKPISQATPSKKSRPISKRRWIEMR
jgi:hypothetical protein